MKEKKIALVGNPNVGKSTLFNLLTGLRQKVGNYPGMTVEKKTGSFIYGETKFNLIDLPGTYGIYPNSLDEQVVADILHNSAHPNHPELAIVVGEPTNLKRSVFLFQQVCDLGIPALFVVNMMDEAEKSGIEFDKEKLNQKLQTHVLFTDARNGKGIEELKKTLDSELEIQEVNFPVPKEFSTAVLAIKELHPSLNDYRAWQYLSQNEIKNLSDKERGHLNKIKSEHKIIPRRLQVKETLKRYEQIDEQLENILTRKEKKSSSLTEKSDKILIHPLWGYLIFFGLLLLIFQAVFAWSVPFMDLIDEGFTWLSHSVGSILPTGPANSLITDGIIAGMFSIFSAGLSVLVCRLSFFVEKEHA